MMEVIPINTKRKYGFESGTLNRLNPSFPGKRFIPQRMVPAKRDPPVYPGLLDSKDPVRGVYAGH